MECFKQYLGFVQLFIFALVLVACGAESQATIITPTKSEMIATAGAALTILGEPITPKPAPPPGWQARWLKGIPCQPPCWEGVIPGHTDATEAVKIFQNSPLISSAKIFPPVPFPNGSKGSKGTITWNWFDGKGGGEASYLANDRNQTIDRIRPAYGDPALRFFKLGEVMQAYGEPSHIRAKALTFDGKTISYYLEFIYVRQGFSLFVGGKDKPVINSDLSLESPNFFEVNLDLASFSDDFALSSWQGFKDFYFYCNKKLECRDS